MRKFQLILKFSNRSSIGIRLHCLIKGYQRIYYPTFYLTRKTTGAQPEISSLHSITYNQNIELPICIGTAKSLYSDIKALLFSGI